MSRLRIQILYNQGRANFYRGTVLGTSFVSIGHKQFVKGWFSVHALGGDLYG